MIFTQEQRRCSRPWAGLHFRADGGDGGAQGRYHLDTNLQLRPLGPISSSQGRDKPQRVERLAPNAVMSRALDRVCAGPRRKAVSSHPYGALAGAGVALIPGAALSQGMER